MDFIICLYPARIPHSHIRTRQCVSLGLLIFVSAIWIFRFDFRGGQFAFIGKISLSVTINGTLITQTEYSGKQNSQMKENTTTTIDKTHAQRKRVSEKDEQIGMTENVRKRRNIMNVRQETGNRVSNDLFRYIMWCHLCVLFSSKR